MTTKKQIEANRANAKKGGVKTPEGKVIVKYNALKHGLLAKEVVITTGDGAENPEEFDQLLLNLQDHYKPQGVVEEMLVEKIAVAYWRLRRVYRHEQGLLREKLDTFRDDFYEQREGSFSDYKYKRPEKIEESIADQGGNIERLTKDLELLQKDGRPLSNFYGQQFLDYWVQAGTYKWEDEGLEDGPYDLSNKEIHEGLKNLGGSDTAIRNLLLDIVRKDIEDSKKLINELRIELRSTDAAFQRHPQVHALPPDPELSRLMKYEGSINRELYRAMNALERVQRMRLGDRVPAPMTLDLSIDGDK